MTYRKNRETENLDELKGILNGNMLPLLTPREFFEKTGIAGRHSVGDKVVEKAIKNIHEEQFDYFKTLVVPGNVKRRELEKFLENLNVCDEDVNFGYYKMYMRQTVFSQEDLHKIMCAVRHASFKNQRFVQEAFKLRVTKEEKAAGHKALLNISNFWLLFTNAFEEPQSLTLRGS